MLALGVRVALVRYCITSKDWELASDDGLPGWSCVHPRLCVPSHLETFSYSGAEFTKQRSFLESLLWAIVTWGVGSSNLSIQGVHLSTVGDDKRFNWPFWVPVVRQAAVCSIYSRVNSLSVRTAVEWKPSPFVWPLPPRSCCVCASALLSVDFVPLGSWHVLSVSVIDFWVI